MATATASLFDLLHWPERPALPALVPPPPPIPPGTREEVRQLRASLETRIASQLSSGSELIRALAKEHRQELTPTTVAPLDTLLGGGLPRGKVVELTGWRNSGRFSIVMAALAGTTATGEAAALIDLGDHFDPQLAARAGVDLRRLLWVRPATMKQAVMAAEMIGATGFQLVILDAGLPPLKGRRVAEASWVRLARTAESHGTAMLVSSPYPLTGTASDAVVNARGMRPVWIGRGKSPRILAGIGSSLRLEKHRRMRAGSMATVLFRMADAIPGVLDRASASRPSISMGSEQPARFAGARP